MSCRSALLWMAYGVQGRGRPQGFTSGNWRMQFSFTQVGGPQGEQASVLWVGVDILVETLRKQLDSWIWRAKVHFMCQLG